jgi:hypothetical protein
MPISFNLPVNANLGGFVLVDGELVEATYAATNNFVFVREFNAGPHHLEVVGVNDADAGSEDAYTWTISGLPLTIDALDSFCVAPTPYIYVDTEHTGSDDPSDPNDDPNDPTDDDPTDDTGYC